MIARNALSGPQVSRLTVRCVDRQFCRAGDQRDEIDMQLGLVFATLTVATAVASGAGLAHANEPSATENEAPNDLFQVLSSAADTADCGGKETNERHDEGE